MINGQVIKNPSGFNKQRLDSFIRSVKTNKEDVQRKELDEALQQHTMLAAQDMLGRAVQLPPIEYLRAAYQNAYLPQMPQAAYGMEIGAVMESAPAPFMYPSQMNITPPNSDMFKKNMDRYEGKGTNALKGLFNTAANAILNPAIMEYNQNVYNAKQKAAQEAKDQEAEDDTPGARYGGSLRKAAYGDNGDPVKMMFKGIPGMEGYTQTESGEYKDPDGNLLTQDQMLVKMQEAYNQYRTEVGNAFANTPTPSWGGPLDLSYLNQYPVRPGLNLPGVTISGEGIPPNLLKGIATPQVYSNIGFDRPSLGQYMGLRPQYYLDPGSVAYSPNYKEMYKDARSKNQFDRFKTDITANPTAMGKFFDKIGIGKLVPTQNYKVKETILPEGQSIFDEDYLEKARIDSIRANYADAPGGGLIEGEELTPGSWARRSRRERRDALKTAGIEPTHKNLKGLGKKYLENERKQVEREGYEAARDAYEKQLAKEQLINNVDYQIFSGARPRNPWDLMGTGTQPVKPAVAPKAPTTPTPAPAGNTTTGATSYNPPAFDLGRTQNQIVKTEDEWFGTKPAGLALPNNYDPDWRNYAVDKGAGQMVYPNANQVKRDWDEVMAKDPKKKAMWESFNDMPAPIREIAADQVFNAGYDPRVMVLGAAGVDKGYTGKGSPVISNPEYRNWLKTNADQLWKDNKALINQQYADDPQAFTSSITDNRKIIYKNMRTKDLPGGVRTDFPSNSGGPGTQYNAWAGRSGAVQDYIDQIYFSPSTGYTAPKYFQKTGGGIHKFIPKAATGMGMGGDPCPPDHYWDANKGECVPFAKSVPTREQLYDPEGPYYQWLDELNYRRNHSNYQDWVGQQRQNYIDNNFKGEKYIIDENGKKVRTPEFEDFMQNSEGYKEIQNKYRYLRKDHSIDMHPDYKEQNFFDKDKEWDEESKEIYNELFNTDDPAEDDVHGQYYQRMMKEDFYKKQNPGKLIPKYDNDHPEILEQFYKENIDPIQMSPEQRIRGNYDNWCPCWKEQVIDFVQGRPITKDVCVPCEEMGMAQNGGTMLPMFETDGEFGFDNGLIELSYPARNMTAEYMTNSCPEGFRKGADGNCYPLIGNKYYRYYMDNKYRNSKVDDQKLTGLDAKPLPLELNNVPITQKNYALPKQYDNIDWNITDPFSKKSGPFNYDLGYKQPNKELLFPDADKMQTFFDNGEAPLTADAFSKQLDQYAVKYTGSNKEPQDEAYAEYDAKLRSKRSAPAYLNVINATGKFLANNVFGRDERRNAEEQFRKSRFLENNLALTSADTQFSPRLRGFDRTTDAYAGAPFAGANVQYGQPLIAQAQKGAELMMTMQEGGVYTLTPEMIKQIIENGGEVEYMDNSINFENPFNQ